MTDRSSSKHSYIFTDFRLSTPLLQDWLGDDAAKRHRREIHFPTGRFGEAIEQAQAVLFLASDESSFVNATEFVVDGGMTKVHYQFALFSFSTC
jgi:NAD(P)-dependent dehydrogenase (short-subunit alcohol dehydrogenase family)